MSKKSKHAQEQKTLPQTNDAFVQKTVKDFVEEMKPVKTQKNSRKAKSYFKRPAPVQTHETADAKHAIIPKAHPPQTQKPLPAVPEPTYVQQPAPAPQSAKEFKEDYSLPSTYHMTYVRLIPRDPYWMYAYWEIDASAIEKMREKLGETLNRCTYTLRLYDVTLVNFDGTNSNGWFDFDELFMGSRYMRVHHDNASYCAAIGVRTPEGYFHAFARSNVASTHPAGISNRTELIWKEVRSLDRQKAFASVDTSKMKLKSYTLTRNDWFLRLSKLPLSAEDIRDYYETGLPLKVILRNRLRRILGQKHAALAQKIEFEGALIEELASGLYKYKKTYRGGTESVIQEFMGASEGLFFRDIKQKKKEFPFELEMELIVKGKTQPDANVYWGNRPVKLNKDGTFTLKMDLNDGALPFDFLAESKDKSLKKKISTSVIRTQTQEETDV